MQCKTKEDAKIQSKRKCQNAMQNKRKCQNPEQKNVVVKYDYFQIYKRKV